MSDVALPGSIEPALKRGPDLYRGFHPLTGIIYMGVVAAALLFVAYNIYTDIAATGTRTTTYAPFILLFVALLIALGFEFVNGFHDTANAVATVIYTRSLPAHIAVVWSGLFNLFGVLLSTGAVAFGIVSLLPVELILQVGSSAGFAMVFALLIAAIIWNVGTWYLGLPASSSHTLIGSIIGVCVANALMRGRDGTSGVDWSQAANIGKALLLSPLFGFALGLGEFTATNFLATPAFVTLPVELYRLQGALLLTRSGEPHAEAEACLQQALAVAHRQEAKSLELRAATSLSRLWQRQGKRAEAYALLAPIYGWFTEGFDTPDLQEAKALLEALA